LSQSCKIVTYHYVRPIKNSKFPNIRGLEIDNFIKQLDYFKKNFKIITQNDILEHIYENKNIPKNSILLTFDDGLKDHFQYVFPLLKKNNISGVFFPPSDSIENKIVLDVHKIHFILEICKNPLEIINEISLYLERLNDSSVDSFENYFSKLSTIDRFDSPQIMFIKKILQRELPRKFRHELVSELFNKLVSDDEESFSRNLYLSLDEIKEMNENNMEFGSHSHSHEWLSFLSENELIDELLKSKLFLTKIGLQDDLTLCYPYGNYNENVKNQAKKMNFKLGYTTEFGDSKLSESECFTLKRLDTNDFPQ
jgi:peptidoglycan/xylan/chitin deacetylase (PgdA/CDA1 family)